MSRLVDKLDRLLYPEYSRNWDDRLLRDRILTHIGPGSVVLDLGAGAGIVREMDFRGLARRVCGVDLDPRIAANPMLDEWRVADVGRIPYATATFDLVYADNLLEHLAEPRAVFAEVARVLKPEGMFVFKTPNRWHYVALIARCTPHRFHAYVNRLRGRQRADTFPTRYRANSVRVVRQLADASGLRVQRLDRIEGRPEYLRISWPTYVIGAVYERLVNSLDVFAPFRVLLVGELRKSS